MLRCCSHRVTGVKKWKAIATWRNTSGPVTWTISHEATAEGLFEEHRIISNNNPMLGGALSILQKSTNKDGIESIQLSENRHDKEHRWIGRLRIYVGYCNHEEEYLRYVR